MRNQNEQVYKLPVTIMRGGTSKGIYILESDLPENREEWDAILLRLMGSPDSKQIDGLGGSQSVTSKVANRGKVTESRCRCGLYVCTGICRQADRQL